ncbi:MAG: LysR family transcriptional regulator [Marinibacterium sp.]|nr:LysR family transcriptional regulator [Marinibacterium sp.]
MTEKLDIDAMRTLLAVARHGGVTRAATHLALSQSAVSHKIRRLERALDCALLSRRPGAPLLTEAGTRLCDYAQRMVDLQDEALSALSLSTLSGVIRLGLTEDTAASGIARVLGRFARLYPQIRVQIRTRQSLVVQDHMAAGELDLAVMQIFARDLQPGDDLLYRDSLHWVKAPALTLDPDGPIPFLSFDEQCFYRQWGMGTPQGLQIDTVLDCPSASGIQAAVRAGLGVALLNGQHVTPDMDRIDTLPSPPELAYILRSRHPRPGAPVRALITEITREARAALPLQQVS